MTPTLQTQPVIITDMSGFGALLDFIHDEHFELDDVRFDPTARIVEIPYRRMFHGDYGEPVRNWLFYKKYEVDVIRSVLTIRNADEFWFNDPEEIGCYSFNTVQYDGGILTFETCERLDLHMRTQQIHIETRDIEIRGKARISYLGIVESNSSRVYE